MRFPVEVVRRGTPTVGRVSSLIFPDFAMDGVLEGGLAWDSEIVTLARAVGNGRCQHPQHALLLAQALCPPSLHHGAARAFASVTGRLHWASVTVPVITSNRINMPRVAESVLGAAAADLVSMARPMLAD